MNKSCRYFFAVSIIGLAAVCGVPASAQVQPLVPIPKAHDGLVIGGKFSIRYTPIMCIRTPCPPGRYYLSLDNQVIGPFRTLVLVRTVDGQNRSTRYEGRYLHGIAGIEGQLRVEGATARIIVSRTVEGAWKP